MLFLCQRDDSFDTIILTVSLFNSSDIFFIIKPGITGAYSFNSMRDSPVFIFNVIKYFLSIIASHHNMVNGSFTSFSGTSGYFISLQGDGFVVKRTNPVT